MNERSEQLEQLEELIDSVEGVVWEADPATFCFTRVSRGAERLLGYPRALWLSGPRFWPDHIHPDDRAAAVEFCLDATRALRNHRFEYRMLAAGGRVVWVRDLVTVVAEAGRPVRLRGLMLDITQEKNAQGALRESERRYRALYDDNPCMYFQVDASGAVLSVNRYGAEYLEYQPEELVGRSVLRLVHEADRERVRAFLRAAFERPEDLGRCEFRKVRKGGSVLWVRETLRLVEHAPDGRVALVVCEDITSHRELEAQLRQAHKMEAIGRLAGNIAHDFNNLLTVIAGCAEEVHGEHVPPERRPELVREILSATERAAALTRHLLAFARQRPQRVRALDVQQAIGELRPMLERLIGTNVALHFDLQASGLVRADPSQLEQIVLNLAINARDAMPLGGELTMALRSVELDAGQARAAGLHAAGRFARIEVKDTGHGMDEETRQRVFEPFFTTKPGRGTGLGLSSVYGIVHQAGGAIGVTSRPGCGATFTVLLPQAPADVEAPVECEDRCTCAHGRGTILLVEDEETVRGLVARTLRRTGYAVIEAGNAADARREFQSNAGSIDLLLTDVLMPGEGGRSLAKALRAARPGLKIVFLSGFPGGADTASAPEVPDHVLIGKPFGLDQLTRVVANALAGGPPGPT